MPEWEPLQVRVLSDRSEGHRVERFDPVTGEKYLVNPDTPGDEHEPWPFAGLEPLEGEEFPKYVRVPHTWVARAKAAGWITATNERVQHRPGGPEESPWKVTHTFLHYDEIIFHTEDGKRNTVYKVIGQPDKYDAKGEPTDEVGNPDNRVRWGFELERVDE